MNFNASGFDNSIIIGPNDLMFLFLKEKNKANVFFDYKTKEIVLHELFGDYNENAIKELMKHDNISYELAKKILNYLSLGYKKDKDKYQWLYDKKLIIKDDLYLNLYKNKNIFFIGYSKNDPEIKSIIEKIGEKHYEFLTIDDLWLEKKRGVIFEFQNVDSEVKYVLNDIANKISNGKKPSDFLLYCNLDTYAFYLNSYANLYNIPINFNEDKTILNTRAGRFLLMNISDTNFNSIYLKYKDKFNDDDIETIKDLYGFYNLNDDINSKINLRAILADKKIRSESYIDGINVISNFDFLENKEIYILGAIDNLIPKLSTNNDIIDDEVKEKNGLTPSYIKNDLSYELTKAFVSLKNIAFISFSNENKTVKPSYFLKNILGFDVKPFNLENYSFSKNLSYLYYLNYLYKFRNFYEVNDELKITKDVYDKPTLYDNSYKLINRTDESLKLSASDINTYANCYFSYFAAKILGLNSFTANFNTNIGNYYHKIFEKIYDDDFDFREIADRVRGNYNFTKKELVLIEKLDEIVEEEAKYIRDENNIFPLTNTFSENKIDEVIKNVPITGRIDRINIYGNDLLVIDYKTGNPKFNMDNFYNFGTDIQLPFYLMQIHNSPIFNKYNILGAAIQQINVKEEFNRLYGLKGKDRFSLSGIIFDNIYCDKDNLNNIKDQFKKVEIDKDSTLTDIIDRTEKYVEIFSESIIKNDFKINPIKALDSCKYCSFRDVCFRKDKDFRENQKDIKENKMMTNGDKHE